MEWQRPPEGLTDHVVLCNLSEQVPCIVAELHDPTVRSRPPIVLVVQDPGLWENHPQWRPEPDNDFTRDHFYVLLDEGGPASAENLQRAGIAAARAAVILADPLQEDLADARSTLVALAIERQNPEIHTVMELIRSINRVHLRSTEVNEVVCVGDMAEKLIAQSCITPGVKNIFTDLLINAQDSNRIFILPLPRSLQGISYRELARRAIRAHAPFVLCGFVRHDFRPAATPVRGQAVSAADSTVVKACAPGGAGGADIYAVQSFVINPRGGADPGRDTALTDRDQLVIIAYERPVLEHHLLPPGA
jgi:hypothetical protein